jgi:hypothetical protein
MKKSEDAEMDSRNKSTGRIDRGSSRSGSNHQSSKSATTVGHYLLGKLTY